MHFLSFLFYALLIAFCLSSAKQISLPCLTSAVADNHILISTLSLVRHTLYNIHNLVRKMTNN